jgi:two-component system chemotaxis response regulator CheY
MLRDLNHSKPKIMVVDDDVPTQILLKKILMINGFRVVNFANNGCDAIEKYKSLISTSNDKPDIILMDHHMPLKTGIEAMKEIQKLNGEVKVIFTSADFQIKEKALANGAVDFIKKPFNAKDILKSINNALTS